MRPTARTTSPGTTAIGNGSPSACGCRGTARCRPLSRRPRRNAGRRPSGWRCARPVPGSARIGRSTSWASRTVAPWRCSTRSRTQRWRQPTGSFSRHPRSESRISRASPVSSAGRLSCRPMPCTVLLRTAARTSESSSGRSWHAGKSACRSHRWTLCCPHPGTPSSRSSSNGSRPASTIPLLTAVEPIQGLGSSAAGRKSQ